MAPPIPVYSQAEMRTRYPTIFDKTNKNCTFHELTQNQCTFNGVDIICLPFTRIFARCLLEGESVKDEKGAQKKREPRYQNVELTNISTNDYKKFNEYYKEANGEDVLKKFLEADKVLRQAYNLGIESSK